MTGDDIGDGGIQFGEKWKMENVFMFSAKIFGGQNEVQLYEASSGVGALPRTVPTLHAPEESALPGRLQPSLAPVTKESPGATRWTDRLPTVVERSHGFL